MEFMRTDKQKELMDHEHDALIKYTKAKKFFEMALMIDEDYPVANFNLAMIYKKLGKMDQAKKFYQRAKELGYEPK
jgi:Tfp pilus assembly protein PilF